MERKIKLLCSIFVICMVMSACKKDEKTIEEEQKTMVQYVLPQGNYPFDKRIVDFHDQYGTYILYKFSEIDFRWGFQRNILFKATPAEPERVEIALNFFDKELFSYYDSEFLKRLLPFKIMLCKEIVPLDPLTQEALDTLADVAQSESHIAFGHVDKRWDSFSNVRKNQLKGLLHGALWSKGIESNKLEVAPGFVDGISYLYVNQWNYKNFGVFNSSTKSASDDIKEYVSRICAHTKSELEALYFNSQFDPTGIYQRKYDALIKYYKIHYNIDLQAIGEAGVK